jgi:serine protease inhibitor
MRSVVLCGLVSFGCASASIFDASTPAGAASASNHFGFDLYTQATTPDKNVVCSPAGASIALTMASAGALGRTQAEMARVLHVDVQTLAAAHLTFANLLLELNGRNGKNGVVLSVANRLWAQRDVSPRSDFLSLLAARYHAPLEQLDFLGDSEAARLAINQWASRETDGRIADLLPQGVVNDKTRLLLTNAVYFNGKWQKPFMEAATFDGPFLTPHGQVTAKLMSQDAGFAYARADGAQILELPYAGGVSMIVVLPDAADGLASVEDRIGRHYDRWVAQLKPSEVDLWLPRWTTKSTLGLADTLSRMGMPLAFDQHQADFLGIADAEALAKVPGLTRLFIAQVLQKAFIETNETGTEEASPGTTVMMDQLLSYDPRPESVPFHADHPFLYLIRDTATGAILFIGRVVDPS